MMNMVCQNTECDITFIHQVDNVELKLWALEERECAERIKTATKKNTRCFLYVQC